MFIRTTENMWINLHECRKVEIHQRSEGNWEIILLKEDGGFIRDFKSRIEAVNTLNNIWDSYEKGQHFWEQEPKEKLNVKLGNRWYAESKALDTFLWVIELIGIEKVKKLEYTFDDGHTVPIITDEKVLKLSQTVWAKHYILKPEYTDTMKKILEYIASELSVDIKVTTNH